MSIKNYSQKHTQEEPPLVTIICIAYNQEKYIAQTIESFLMQQTNFKFEIIVHDDASTDKTAEIIRKYAKNHPGLFKLILQKENQYSQYGVAFLGELYRKATGKYVCVCEGDDYWSDQQKLQLQVDFLESHPDYAVCFHPVRVIFEDNSEEDVIFPNELNGFSLKKLLKGNYIQTNSVMYRTQTYEDIPTNILPIDWYMHLYHARFGKIGFINKVMAVYRRHSGGLWWQSIEDRAIFLKNNCDSHMRLFVETINLFQDQPAAIRVINITAASLLQETLTLNNDPKYIEEMVVKYPKFTAAFIHTLISQDLRNQEIASDRLEEIHRLNCDLEHSQIMRIRAENESMSLKSSKAYKTGNVVIKPLRAVKSIRKSR